MSDNALGLRQSMLLALQLARKNRSLFIDAMDDPMRRRIAFDVVERNCRERFAEGEDGVRPIFSYLAMSNLPRWTKQLRNLSVGLSRCSTENFWRRPIRTWSGHRRRSANDPTETFDRDNMISKASHRAPRLAWAMPRLHNRFGGHNLKGSQRANLTSDAGCRCMETP
jgi:hypothetical protein